LSLGGKTPDVGARTYVDVMREQHLRAEDKEVRSKESITANIFVYLFNQ